MTVPSSEQTRYILIPSYFIIYFALLLFIPKTSSINSFQVSLIRMNFSLGQVHLSKCTLMFPYFFSRYFFILIHHNVNYLCFTSLNCCRLVTHKNIWLTYLISFTGISANPFFSWSAHDLIIGHHDQNYSHSEYCLKCKKTYDTLLVCKGLILIVFSISFLLSERTRCPSFDGWPEIRLN